MIIDINDNNDNSPLQSTKSAQRSVATQWKIIRLHFELDRLAIQGAFERGWFALILKVEPPPGPDRWMERAQRVREQLAHLQAAQRGGRQPKVRVWAQKYADELVRQYPGKSAAWIMLHIPGAGRDDDIDFYKDGDNLCHAGTDDSIALPTFRRYLDRARQILAQ